MDSWWALLDIKKKKVSRKNDFVIEKSIPRILKILKKYNIKATFFVLGPDVESFPKLYKEVIKQGHEIGNHTYSHFHNLKDLPEKEIYKEIKKTHDIIKKKLNYTCVGFRAPNYSFNYKVLNVLKKLNYKYDSSLSPSFYPSIFPLSALKIPKKPFKLKNSNIIELPLSSSPFFRLPVFGTPIRVLGQWWLITNKLLLPWLNINFHARDAVPEIPKEPGLPALVYINLKTTTQRLDRALKYLSKKTKTMRMDKFAEMIK